MCYREIAIKENLLEKQSGLCPFCNTLIEIKGKQVLADINHKDGNHNNNIPSNLEWMHRRCHLIGIHKIPENLNELKFLTDNYIKVQKLRVATGNQLLHEKYETIKKLYAELQTIEKELLQIIKEELNTGQYKIWTNYLSKIAGVGPIFGAILIARIYDIKRFNYPSGLHSYCGLSVINGKAKRKTKNEKANWDQILKSKLFLLGKSFVMHGQGYRVYYEKFKEQENQKHPELSAKHRDIKARRKTVKLFLSHLYEVWYKIEGLEPTKPYSQVMLQGHEYIKPFIDKNGLQVASHTPNQTRGELQANKHFKTN